MKVSIKYPVFIALCLAVALVWWVGMTTYRDSLVTEKRTELQEHFESHKRHIQTSILQRLNYLYNVKSLLTVHLRVGQPLARSAFMDFSEELTGGLGGVDNLAWAPLGVQTFVYPLVDNENVIGHNLLTDERPHVQDDVKRAIQSQTVTVSKPYELRQGGVGLVARLAVFWQGEFQGFMTTVLDLAKIFQEIGQKGCIFSSRFVLWNGKGDVFFGDADLTEKDLIKVMLDLPGDSWELGLLPKKGWDDPIRSALMAVQISTFFLLTTLLGIFYLFLTKNQRLEQMVVERTTQLQISERQWQDAFNAVKSPIFLYDNQGKIIKANLAYLDLAGAPLEDAVGQFYWELFPQREGAILGSLDGFIPEAPFCSREIDVHVEGKVYRSQSFAVCDPQGKFLYSLHLMEDITEEKYQENSFQKDLNLKTALSELFIPLISSDSTLESISRHVLEQAKQLTGSEHGYVGEISPTNGDLIVHTLTDMFAGHCQVEEKHQHIIFPMGENGLYPNLWGHSLNTRAGFLSNNPLTHAASKGVPAGHVLLKQFLSIPVVLNDQLIGQIALANPGREYLQEDLAQLAHLVEFFALAVQRIRTTETLRRYEQIISTGSEMMAFVDSDQIYQAVNDAYVKFFNTTRDKIVGRHIREVIGTERYEQQTKRKVKQCLQGKTVVFQAWANYPDVGRHHLEVQYSPYIEETGEVSGFVARVKDITLQTDQEAKLRLSAKVFESTTEGITITDRDGCILAVNQAFSTITGYLEEEVLGKNPRVLQSGRHNEIFYQKIWRSLKKEGHWQGEIWNQRKNGEIYPERLTINSVRDENGEVSNYVAVFSDSTPDKLAMERLEHQAHHHPLTGLPNRLLLHARLTHSIQHAQREKHLGAVLFIDLDNFKNVNDSLGHMAGDEILKAVSLRLMEHNRQVDTVAHLSGDEFVVVMERVDSLDAATSMAQQLLNKLQQPFVIQDYELYLGGSIGITLFPGDGNDVDSLLKNADAAMYKAKAAGKNCYQIYTPELTETAIERVLMESHLRRVLENNELVLHYQPQVTVPEGKIVAVEALVRWQHPDMGLVPPDKFIPLSEETGMIIPMGEWILKTACEQLVAWRQQGLEIKKVAVNLSGRQLQQKNLLEMVERVLRETGCPATSLELEITEGFIMQHPEQSVAVLQQIRNLGVDLAVDDFGTGHSSLNYLKKLPINRLKIDRSFVWDIHQNLEGEAIIKAIIAMGHSLNLEITAEGVETAEQLTFLADRGCNEAQGFLFSRPLPAEEVERLF